MVSSIFSHVGIRCNAIAPGFLVSNQNRTLLFDEQGNPTPRANKFSLIPQWDVLAKLMN
ncbi:Uncharacterized oxidoreductase HI_0048 [Actinobacillus equuli]|nr:Uncharacterized oxidoreductase HI_0048 [Actinobacillus equuli]